MYNKTDNASLQDRKMAKLLTNFLSESQETIQLDTKCANSADELQKLFETFVSIRVFDLNFNNFDNITSNQLHSRLFSYESLIDFLAKLPLLETKLNWYKCCRLALHDFILKFPYKFPYPVNHAHSDDISGLSSRFRLFWKLKLTWKLVFKTKYS